MSKNPFIIAGIGLFLMLSLPRQIIAQQQFGPAYHYHFVDLGIGMGLDYGGLVGVKAAYILPIRQISVFGAAGVQLFGLGWSVGTTLRILSMKKNRVFRPNVKIMYGINRSTMVIDASEYDAMFTGWTPGVGAEFRFGKQKSSGFDIDINFPLGSADFEDQLNRIENDPRVESIFVLPVAFSIGYHREF